MGTTTVVSINRHSPPPSTSAPRTCRPAPSSFRPSCTGEARNSKSGWDCSDSSVADDEIFFEGPGVAPTLIAADSCSCSGALAGGYDIWACKADVTDFFDPAESLIGTYAVSEYVGRWEDGSTDNASCALLLVFEESSLPPRRVVLYDGNLTFSNNRRVFTLDGFTVDTTPSGDLTFYALEGDIGGSDDEEISVDGQPGAAGPIGLDDALNPPNNPVNRTINTTDPPRSGVLGVDIDQFDISGALSPLDTAVDVTYVADGDKWWLIVNVVGIDEFAPPSRRARRRSGRSWWTRTATGSRAG